MTRATRLWTHLTSLTSMTPTYAVTLLQSAWSCVAVDGPEVRKALAGIVTPADAPKQNKDRLAIALDVARKPYCDSFTLAKHLYKADRNDELVDALGEIWHAEVKLRTANEAFPDFKLIAAGPRHKAVAFVEDAVVKHHAKHATLLFKALCDIDKDIAL